MDLIPVLAISAFAFLAYQAAADLRPALRQSPSPSDVVARIAAERLHRGEIDRDEYARIVRVMNS